MTAHLAQPGILELPPLLRRSLRFRLLPRGIPAQALDHLQQGWTVDGGVVGLGQPLLSALDRTIPGLRAFPALDGAGVGVPSTQSALVVFLHASERGPLFDRAEAVTRQLAGAFAVEEVVDSFLYDGGRDLTGYEDGTENPRDDAAVAAALVADGPGLAGSSFLALQRWVHDLAGFAHRSSAERDAVIGRRRADNEEIDDAPPSAHVKRSAQESFAPAAFMLRRSLPWDDGRERGLEFLAYGADLDRFERVLRRMAGLEDGIVDGLFSFSRPVTGGYYWCPPVAGSRLDLSALDL